MWCQHCLSFKNIFSQILKTYILQIFIVVYHSFSPKNAWGQWRVRLPLTTHLSLSTITTQRFFFFFYRQIRRYVSLPMPKFTHFQRLKEFWSGWDGRVLIRKWRKSALCMAWQSWLAFDNCPFRVYSSLIFTNGLVFLNKWPLNNGRLRNVSCECL